MAGLFVAIIHCLRTLTIPAHVADRTAPFMLNRTATLRAGSPFVSCFLDTGVVTAGKHVRLNRLGNSIGARENLAVAKAGRTVAGDAEKLLDHLPRLDAASPGEGDHPADCFCL